MSRCLSCGAIYAPAAEFARLCPSLHLTAPRRLPKEAPCDGPVAQLVEQLTFNQWVTGSNPVGLTTVIKDLAEILPGVPIGRRRSGGTPLAQWAALTAAWRGRARDAIDSCGPAVARSSLHRQAPPPSRFCREGPGRLRTLRQAVAKEQVTRVQRAASSLRTLSAVHFRPFGVRSPLALSCAAMAA